MGMHENHIYKNTFELLSNNRYIYAQQFSQVVLEVSGKYTLNIKLKSQRKLERVESDLLTLTIF